MEHPLPDTDLVIATPERVSFDYQVAGLGTRAIAQLLDLLILGGVLIAVLLFGVAAGAISGSQTIGTLIEIIGAFVVVFGYFWVSEALWSGQTIGKKAFRLRAVGDRGEPLTFMQAGIRNVVRIVDFLPYGYGVGFVVMFANGKGKRLGDLAAGTIVVKDSDHVWLWQLPGAQRPVDPSRVPPPPGAQPGVAYSQNATPPPPAYGAGIPLSPYTPASLGEQTLRRIDPELRRFVSSYARRRGQLSLELRVQLASIVQPGLKTALPDVFAQSGPLAALDHLADLDRQ
ncbi:MAG TPA: RDD family protein [Candidatus Dormibacteraeota bacterium]|nr:RDD family protein [Candidatus Dormibacteraeota bacterium]